MTSLIVAFRNFANASKNDNWCDLVTSYVMMILISLSEDLKFSPALL
jgi:hypothetical protein